MVEARLHSINVSGGGVPKLARELIEELRSEGHPIAPGTIGENLTLAGLPWKEMRPGVRLEVGDVLKEGTLRVGDRVRMLQPTPTGANHGS